MMAPWHYIGLRHCAELNYENNATRVARSEFYYCNFMTRAKQVLY